MSQRLELVVPIVFVRGDMDKAGLLCKAISSNLVSLTFKQVVKCLKIRRSLCSLKVMRWKNTEQSLLPIIWRFTYLNYNNILTDLLKGHISRLNNQLYSTALVQWVKYADITANRAGIICLDKPGMFISVITGLYNKGYIDFYGRQQKNMDTDGLIKKAESVHAVSSRNLKTDNTMSESLKAMLSQIY